MKKHDFKRMCCLAVLSILFMFPLQQTVPAQDQEMFTSVHNEIRPFSEITGYKYKTINGMRYKRLWSYTYERWIDENWTPA